MSVNRRNFIRSSAAGLVGSILYGNEMSAETGSFPFRFEMGNPADDEEWWKSVKSQFPLEEKLLYFNNGSLGPSPDYVIKNTEVFRRLLDGFPSKYMWGGWNSDKERVRSLIAGYFSADSEEIAVTHNTTEGMNLFARSFDLKEGDEIILADHEHPTGVNPYEYFCKPLGIKLVRPVLPLLPESPEEIADVYRRAITGRTRLISMVHMTNTNGMILPVRQVSEMAHNNNIIVCVDGAQSAGMFKVDLPQLGCDFYAASGHKWLFGPKGTGILFARKEKRHLLKPLMVSSNWNRSDIRMFEDYNTRNLPEYLGLGSAIEFNNMLVQDRKQERIYALKRYFRGFIEDDSRFRLMTPASDSLSAGIQVVEVEGKSAGDAGKFLTERYNIDCRPMSTNGLNALRISLSVFNTREDIDILVKGLREFAGL
jgi:isopenicillin-N epimerase